jgi:hypothetical protein
MQHNGKKQKVNRSYLSVPQFLVGISAICGIIKEQVRGFAPIGMVECWNIGKMGLDLRLGEDTAILGKWQN